MIAVEDPKLLFVHNQKTGGMSIADYLNNELQGNIVLDRERHAYAEDGIRKLGRKKWDEYYSFGFVRNPWDRLASWYVMICETPQIGHNPLWDYVQTNSNTFEEFIINCTDIITEQRGDFLYQKSFTRPQLEYFTDDGGEIATSFIGRFENLQADFDSVLGHVGLLPHKLPLINSTRKKDYRSFYNDRTVQIVADRFKKDIDYFNYKFD